MSNRQPRSARLIVAVVALAVAGSAWLGQLGAGLSGPRAARAQRAGSGTGAVLAPAGARSRIDWTRGLVIETGAAAGDLRAPSPGVARVAAERQAREAARARLGARARKLVLASGEQVSKLAGGDQTVAARLDRAIARSLDLAVDYSSDGSVVLTAGLPLEAIRRAVAGPQRPPPGRESGAPSAVIVDASTVLKGPVLGLELAAGKERYAGPTVFYRSARAAAGDPRLGPRAVRARAQRRKKAQLWLDSAGGEVDPAVLGAAREAGALVVILLPQ